MIYNDFKDFIAVLPSSGRLMGIDWGARRCGVAISDERQEFAFPRAQLSGVDQNLMIQEILKSTKSEQIIGIIIGLPLRLDGTESDTTRRVRDFANNVSQSIDLPIILLDESLTSFAAGQRQSESGCKTSLDSESATVLLENAMAIIKRITNSNSSMTADGDIE